MAQRKGNTPRAPVHLAESMLRQLNGYSLAAGAAGVAVLACSGSAEAAPICGKLSVILSRTETYAFNPAHQKVSPFNVAQTYNDISSHSMSRGERGFFTPNTPDAKVILSVNGFPQNMASGASIGPGGKFGKVRSYGLLFDYSFFRGITGNFKSGQFGYIGFQFSQTGQIHYGWLRLRLGISTRYYVFPSLLLSEFGYESTPNTAITAGNCAASASTVVPTPKPKAVASLGLLALGHPGLPIWRRQIQP
jgi:hypothetical protein